MPCMAGYATACCYARLSPKYARQAGNTVLEGMWRVKFDSPQEDKGANLFRDRPLRYPCARVAGHRHRQPSGHHRFVHAGRTL